MSEFEQRANQSPESSWFMRHVGHPLKQSLNRSLNWVKEHPLTPFVGVTIALGVASAILAKAGSEYLSNALGLAAVASAIGVGAVAMIDRKKLKNIWKLNN